MEKIYKHLKTVLRKIMQTMESYVVINHLDFISDLNNDPTSSFLLILSHEESFSWIHRIGFLLEADKNDYLLFLFQNYQIGNKIKFKKKKSDFFFVFFVMLRFMYGFISFFNSDIFCPTTCAIFKLFMSKSHSEAKTNTFIDAIFEPSLLQVDFQYNQ